MDKKEKEEILSAALEAINRNKTINTSTRFFEEIYDLKTGKPVDAARGLEDRMRVDKDVTFRKQFFDRVGHGVKGLQEEAKDFEASSPVEGKEVMDILDYILHQETSEKAYVNGIRDEGRGNVKLGHFLTHNKAQRALLTESEVVALRLYTTSVFKWMNTPLRDDKRYEEDESCPLCVATHFAVSGIRKLRALEADKDVQTVLWRGMRQVKVTDEFMRVGGTELAFMSITRDVKVAVRYCLSEQALLLRIVVPGFMSIGAELKWLSAFPGEAEVLFPPLTYLKPTGKRDEVSVEHGGKSFTLTVVEVTATIA